MNLRVEKAERKWAAMFTYTKSNELRGWSCSWLCYLEKTLAICFKVKRMNTGKCFYRKNESRPR